MYFHDPKAPIQEQAAQLGIKSRAFNWAHDSMSWQDAQEHIFQMYRTIKNSSIMPIVDFDFWSLPYYDGMGLPLRRIKSFAAVAGEMLVATLGDAPVRFEIYEDRLTEALTGRLPGAWREGEAVAAS